MSQFPDRSVRFAGEFPDQGRGLRRHPYEARRSGQSKAQLAALAVEYDVALVPKRREMMHEGTVADAQDPLELVKPYARIPIDVVHDDAAARMIEGRVAVQP